MSINLTTQNSYPLNGTSTFPIGEEIKLEFTNLVDEKTAKDSIILIESVSNSVVETDIKVYVLDASNNEIEDVFLERQVSQKTLVIVKPKAYLNENSSYELFIRGESLEEVASLTEEFSSSTISEKTVFGTSLNDVFTDQIRVYGSYTGKTETYLNVEIVSGGSGSGAKYIWWFNNEAKPTGSKRLNRTVTRWRSLNRGCYIKFYGGEYTLGDVFKVKVFPKEKLANSYRISFETSSDTLIIKPEVTSESDIGLVTPESTQASFTEALRIIDMQPRNGSINNSISTNKITIFFNKNIKTASVNQNNIKLLKQSVSGFFNSKGGEEKIPKEIIIENNKIILEF
jgi:DNA polymerase II large subunit